MSEEQVAKIFKPFSQADISTTRKYGGTGLGLMISKRIIEAMDGCIEVKSKVDIGSEFIFNTTLEYIKDAKPTHSCPEPEGRRVLVVDDQEISRIILSEMLIRCKFVVKTADSANSAFEMILDADRRNIGFDFILMDWNMPDINGVDAIKTIHKMKENGILSCVYPTILMVSAYEKDNINMDGIQVSSYLHKPVTASRLFDAMISGNETLRNSFAEEHTNKGGLANIKILLVEDNEINQEVAQKMLQNFGAVVTLANNGKEAVDMVSSGANLYDIILMDIQMPIMGGYEACRIIRTFNKDIPIVALTAAAAVEDKQKAIESGMNDYVSKPIYIDTLYSVILKSLNKTMSGDDLLGIANYKSNAALSNVLLDYERLKNTMGGDLESVSKLLKMFTESLDGNFANIVQLLKNKDANAPVMIHAIKGVAGNMAAGSLHLAAKKIDAIYKSGAQVSNSDIAHFDECLTLTKAHIKDQYLLTSTKKIQKIDMQNFKIIFKDVMDNLHFGRILSDETISKVYYTLADIVEASELDMWKKLVDTYEYDKAFEIMTKWLNNGEINEK
jgi:CheY-like chemotaxis protein/HPt (histidine-containing phosphotransfer) domain-containing protein